MADSHSTRTCALQGCQKHVKPRHQMCSMHIARIARHGDPSITLNHPLPSICVVPGCSNKPHSKGLCDVHRQRLRIHGSFSLPPRPVTAKPTRECVACGKQFPERRSIAASRASRYCSRTCFCKHARESALVARASAARRHCRECSRLLRAKYSETCRRCQVKAQTRAKWESVCLSCGNSFARRSDRPTNRFCSRACFASFESKCKKCGGVIVGAGRRYCSDECQHRHYWEELGGRLRNREHVHRYKALKRGSATEPIDCARLFERDGWRCQLCQRRIDPRRKHPDPLSATIDHIVPISLGGSHTWQNVQAAHFACNSSKNAKIRGQLRIF